jgi:outer membrane protein OmpA-like peptidoglycan-associated protein
MTEHPVPPGPERWEEMFPPPPVVTSSGAVATYVSLFLILFVFFIVLFSIAAQDQARRRAVLDGLDNAFGHLPSALGAIAPTSGDSNPTDPATGRFVVDAEASLGALATRGHGAGPARPGTILNVSLPPEHLFVPGTPALQPAAVPVLQQLAVLLQRHPGGERFRVDVTANASTPDDTALARARVAVIAARLYAEGCPADGVTVAVANAAWSGIRLDFVATPSDAADN